MRAGERDTHVVWKFSLMPLIMTGAAEFTWPKDAKILHIAHQGISYRDGWFAWCEVPLENTATGNPDFDIDKHFEVRRFIMHGTGHPFEKESKDALLKEEFVQTIFSDTAGTYVFHIYELQVG